MAARLIQRGDLDGAQKRLDAIVAQTDRAGALVEEFVEAARVSSQTVGLRPERLNLAEIVRSAEELARTQVHGELDSRSVKFELLDGCDGLWDKRQVTRALSALIKNACLYGDPAAPLRIEMHREDRRIVVRVSGGGPGPSAAESDRLFQPFFRGEASAQLGQGGSGLGLYTARGVARASGGDVRQALHHSPDTFEMELPLGVPVL